MKDVNVIYSFTHIIMRRGLFKGIQYAPHVTVPSSLNVFMEENSDQLLCGLTPLVHIL